MSKHQDENVRKEALATETLGKAEKEEAKIAKTPTWQHLLKFSLPTMLSILTMGIFAMVGGMFAQRLIGPEGLQTVSFMFPFIGFIAAFGFMMGVGGNALVAKKLGEGKEKEARENFSLIALASFLISVTLALISGLFPDVVFDILRVDDYLRPMALDYLMPVIWLIPFTVLGMIYQQALITVGKAHYLTVLAIAGGITSIALNFILIGWLDMGIMGSAFATLAGFTLPFIVGQIFFAFNRNHALYLVRPKWDYKALGWSAVNGSSELVTMLSTSIATVLMNNALMIVEGGGRDAVGAAGIMMAGMGIFASIFNGYGSGVMPIISYNYGKNDRDNLKMTYTYSLRIVGILSVLSLVLTLLLSDALLAFYGIPAGTSVHDMARTGLRFLAFGFILMGFNSFASMFFTALNNGVVSSIISFARTLLFVAVAFLTLPRIFGLTGAWMAMPAAEVLAIFVTVIFFKAMKKKYGYA